ncbi:MAG: cupin domain-containing protein [Opitutaceae bacterium]|nr:cupin domain-containing protein [Opitutaceae bacterium]
MTFASLSQQPAKEIFGGTIRGHYAHTGRMTIGEVHIQANTTLPTHSHPHEQVSYVLAGRVEFTVGDQTSVLEAGMVALIPGGVSHGCKALTACRILDVFTPVREDLK